MKYNTPIRKNPQAARGNLVLFRTVCVIIAIGQFICAIACSSNHRSAASLTSLLFGFVFTFLIFVPRNPGVGWWLSLFGLVLVWLILLAVEF
jgi:hypothetical protein